MKFIYPIDVDADFTDAEVNGAITQLEDRGYIFRGAYNRLLKCVPQVGESSWEVGLRKQICI